VFDKFSQGARQPTGAIATVDDLDRFLVTPYINNNYMIILIMYSVHFHHHLQNDKLSSPIL